IRFHPAERSEQRPVRCEITVVPPTYTHLAGGMRDAEAAEIARQVLYQTATAIVVKPILQIMQTGKIFARTFTAAIPVDLDIVQQPFRSPIRFWLIQHPGEAERDFEKHLTFHALKIH